MARHLSHPFGRENKVAVEKLFTFFCNNLHLGQWELAQACANGLNQQKQLLEIDILKYIKDIVANPSCVR